MYVWSVIQHVCKYIYELVCIYRAVYEYDYNNVVRFYSIQAYKTRKLLQTLVLTRFLHSIRTRYSPYKAIKSSATPVNARNSYRIQRSIHSFTCTIHLQLLSCQLTI